MAQRVFIGIGSNLGNRFDYLRKAREALAPEVILSRSSRIYETPPWGYKDQPAFLNQVLEVQTDLDPEALLQKLKKIEMELGRVENFRYGPRCIDLDILFYGNLIYNTETLKIPHPALTERAFVLVPLNELAPEFTHPQLNLNVSELLEKLHDNQIILFQDGS
jgi:2-amino-4-hydroxy-6-hydroxymethyldihydropteridine diphosphokinase